MLGIKSKLPSKNKNLPVKSEKQSPTTQTTKTTKEKISKEKDDTNDIYAISYNYFSKRASFLFPRLIKLEKNLKVAGMLVHYEAYVCMMVFISIIAGIIFGVIGAIVAALVNISPAALGVMLPIFLAIIGMQATFGFAYMYPAMNAKGRASKIQQELPYYIGYMATLTASGLGIEGVFKAIASEQSKEEMVKDARLVVRNLELMGMDSLSVLQDLYERAPEGPYAELIQGLISTVQSGGGLKEYFLATAHVQLEEKKLMLRKTTASLGIVAEMYTILLIVFPLLTSIILSIMAIMTSGLAGISLPTMLKGLTYVFVPVLGLMMLYMMDSMVPKR